MEKRSNHYLDVFRWIEKVIDSCKTYPQTIVARRLIDNYENSMKIQGIEYRTIVDLEYKLRLKLLVLQNELIDISK
jgi:hypothetical protein